MVWGLLADGYNTVPAVRTELNRQGVRGARGGHWGQSATCRLVREANDIPPVCFTGEEDPHSDGQEEPSDE